MFVQQMLLLIRILHTMFHDDKDHYDLVRGPKVKIFDMYYDKFKDGS